MVCMPQCCLQNCRHITQKDQQHSYRSHCGINTVKKRVQKHVRACVKKEERERGESSLSGEDLVNRDAVILLSRHHKWRLLHRVKLPMWRK